MTLNQYKNYDGNYSAILNFEHKAMQHKDK